MSFPCERSQTGPSDSLSDERRCCLEFLTVPSSSSFIQSVRMRGTCATTVTIQQSKDNLGEWLMIGDFVVQKYSKGFRVGFDCSRRKLFHSFLTRKAKDENTMLEEGTTLAQIFLSCPRVREFIRDTENKSAGVMRIWQWNYYYILCTKTRSASSLRRSSVVGPSARSRSGAGVLGSRLQRWYTKLV